MARPCAVFGLFLSAAPVALAHGGGTSATGGAAWWERWHLDPLIVSNLALLAALYVLGWRRRHRLRPPPKTVRTWQAGAFAAGWLALVAALLSPLDVFAGELLSVHMVQHMILMNVAAPLVMLGAPGRVLWWALSDQPRQEVARWRRGGRSRPLRFLLWQPVVLWLLYATLLWLWHVPALYQAALEHRWVHDVQHVAFFGAAALFWRVLFDPLGRLQLGRIAAVVYLFTTSLHATVLGVFMALAPRLWYPFYTGRAAALGWDPLQDQQLAGYIMWMPACMSYAVAAAVIFATSLAPRRRADGLYPA